MKKLYVVIALIGIASWTMTSCGSKKEEKKEGSEDAYETAEPEKSATEPAKSTTEDLIAQGHALMDASDCKTCHLPDRKVVGPAHIDVAKKYEFTKTNVALLSDKIIKGGSGAWGDIPMTAHPDLSKADAEKMAMYILSLDGEKYKE